MKSFLAEHWIWIALPFLLVLAGVLALLAVDADAVNPFDYRLD